MEYSVETAMAVIVDGNVNLKIDTQHLRELSFRIGSIYQFIGELLVQSDNEVKYHFMTLFLSLSVSCSHTKVWTGRVLMVLHFQATLQARVGRNVDGIDLNLYHQSLQLLRQFQADHFNKRTN